VKVEAVIFDWDGTLIDLNERELYSINKALTSVGFSTISKERYVQGYYLNLYNEFGARNLIKKTLKDKTLIDRALETYSREFSKTMHLIKPQAYQ